MTEAEQEQQLDESRLLSSSTRLSNSTSYYKRSDSLPESSSQPRTRLAAPLLVEVYGRTVTKPVSFSSKKVFTEFLINLVRRGLVNDFFVCDGRCFVWFSSEKTTMFVSHAQIFISRVRLLKTKL
jgi:hypothetical protein